MTETRLHIDIRGDGPPIVLAHGFGGSARNFRPQQRAFGERYAVVAFDQRGHARSDAPERPDAYSLAQLANDFLSVLGHIGATRAIVGGLSLGAAAALEFALAHPKRVQALVLAAMPGSAGFASYAEPFADAVERDGLEAAGERFVWGAESGLDATGAALVRQGFLEHPPHAVSALLRGAIRELSHPQAADPRVAGCHVPTLLIHGDRDRPAATSSNALAKALPNASVVVIPDAGHVVNLAQPHAFNAALERFLADLAVGAVL